MTYFSFFYFVFVCQCMPHANRLFHLQVPVPLLKEKIATVTGILSEQQRLICRGRVLKDDELLSAYRILIYLTLHSLFYCFCLHCEIFLLIYREYLMYLITVIFLNIACVGV